MTTIWIGDFRAQQLRNMWQAETSEDVLLDYLYMIEDTADYSWFVSHACPHLALLSQPSANIVIMLGLNDCIQGRTWSSFNTADIVNNYATAINNLISLYPRFTFHICSVNPVDGAYPTSAHKKGAISAAELNKEIELFNSILKNACPTATFIDSYTYLSSTKFNTRDGIRFDYDTCKSVASYIENHLNKTTGLMKTTFELRITDDRKPNTVLNGPDAGDADLYWVSDQYGGYNPFPISDNKHTTGPQDTLPNCTAYAWGRFYEILGSQPKLARLNAEYWFLEDDGYARGQEPQPGAVICWAKGNIGDDPNVSGTDAGHVGIVEQVNPDGSIITSESGWQDERYWWYRPRTNENGNWGANEPYIFQGFIYNPAVSGVGVATEDIPKSQVVQRRDEEYHHAGYLTASEKQINAKFIWNYLGTREEPWTVKAVAALLGNMDHESAVNPSRSFSNIATNSGGFGLVQWTPPAKFTRWLDYTKNNIAWTEYNRHTDQPPALAENLRAGDAAYEDIENQLARIEYERNSKSYQSLERKNSPVTGINSLKAFSTSDLDVQSLAKWFCWNYERPKSTLNGFTEAAYETLNERAEAALMFYNLLVPYAPTVDTRLFTATNLKISKLAETSFEFSLITCKAVSGTYSLNNGTEKAFSNSLISDEVTVVTQKINNLVPNTKYTLKININGEDGEIIELSMENITTPQSRPKSVNDMKLELNEPFNNTVKLTLSPISNWGYWRDITNKYGYFLYLIINGRPLDKISVSGLTAITNIKLTDFEGYKYHLGDIIQIGVQPWVLDRNGNYIYDTAEASIKTSNTVNTLNTTMVAYLNN